MEIFAVGNKYKLFGKLQLPVLIDDCYFIYGWKWNKTKQEWFRLNTYNVGPHYEVIKENA